MLRIPKNPITSLRISKYLKCIKRKNLEEFQHNQNDRQPFDFDARRLSTRIIGLSLSRTSS